MKYRKDIQVLRGIALIMAIAYHFLIPGSHNGYFAADIFFVISGFLMAKLYDPKNTSDYFVKRAKRLLPAYFSVVFLTLLVGSVITKPTEFFQLREQVLFAVLFIPNIGFWMEASYFDNSLFRPLLHLWSMGVEFQFYLLVPFFAALIERRYRLFLLVLSVSAIACFLMVEVSAKTSFYWLPFRFWEFLLGFWVARRFSNDAAPRLTSSPWYLMAFLFLIVWPLLPTTDGTGRGMIRGQPNVFMALECVVTALLLAYPIDAQLIKARAFSVLEWLGKHSYAIYLSHFPIQIFLLYRPFEGMEQMPQSILQWATVFAGIPLGAVLLHRLIEKPFLERLGFSSAWFLCIPLTFALAFVAGHWQRKFVSEHEWNIHQAQFDRNEYRCGKIFRLANPTAISCELSPKLASPARRVMLVGDSHSDSIKYVFNQVAQKHNVAVHFIVENEPLTAGRVKIDRLIDEALEKQVDQIVIHYSRYWLREDFLEPLVARARSRGLTLAILMPTPTWQEFIPRALSNNLLSNSPLPTQSLSQHLEKDAPLRARLTKLPSQSIQLFETAPIFCRPMCRVADEAMRPFYYDRHHMTTTGASQLTPVFDELIRAVTPAKRQSKSSG